MAKKIPTIGISGSWLKDASGNFAGYVRSYVNHDYVRSIYENGGIPIILPFVDQAYRERAIDEWVDKVDGIIMSGGHDISPLSYNEEPKQGLGQVWPERDRFDLLLIKKALEKRKPIFGICRGFQILNVYFGGTLYQDLSFYPTETLRHNQVSDPTIPTQTVTLEIGKLMHKILGEPEVFVNSFHHQVIKQLGKDLIVTATAKDGVIEGFSTADERVFATQFHPEMMSGTDEKMKQLFAYFVQFCEHDMKK